MLEKRIGRRSSRTAIVTALTRAVANKEFNNEIFGPDYLDRDGWHKKRAGKTSPFSFSHPICQSETLILKRVQDDINWFRGIKTSFVSV